MYKKIVYLFFVVICLTVIIMSNFKTSLL
ncbi:hypothetical protein SLH52_15005 [Cytobacillus sp. IB215665]|nr:hypothetical protein [Cytobacillus sp. IB215665]MDX8366496.1 hypothetical protein [Cytobacillus sp. IB215665]